MKGNLRMTISYNKQSTNILRTKPFLKWVGGKTQMLEILHESMPLKYNKYIEPFIGGGALFFSLNKQGSIIADINDELINSYNVVQNDVDHLINTLSSMKNTEEDFYRIRALKVDELSEIERAARLIYLNKTCFNGLYRVNMLGQFNTPFGKYKNPNICDSDNLRLASEYLRNTTIIQGDYKQVLLNNANPGDFIFLDPPYIPVSEYSDFNRYTKEKFDHEEQVALADEVRRLHELGCFVLLTNSDHEKVHELYKDYEIKTYNTKRFINSNGNKRIGKDVLVKVMPKQIYNIGSLKTLPNPQYKKYPSTRYMGSKSKLLENIWSIASAFEFNSVLDLFSGSGVVSYMFKSNGKKVISNDYMTFTSEFAKAMIENNHTKLNKKDIEKLLERNIVTDSFVQDTFKDLYFSDEDNMFIDIIRTNIPKLSNGYKKALAKSAITRACMKKRPRGIFAYTGFRYDDGRRDVSMTLEEQFLRAIEEFNAAVFDNGQENKAKNMDSLNCHSHADLVYFDPPYYSTRSDNEYVRRYHFVEGIAKNWKDVEMQWETKTKKFKSYPSAFTTYKGAYDAFDMLFKRHRNSILLVSYSSNSLPTKDEILELMKKYKRYVDVVEIDYKYTFGNQGNSVGNNKNDVQEYIFLGY
jgi:DNA adenine methylase